MMSRCLTILTRRVLVCAPRAEFSGKKPFGGGSSRLPAPNRSGLKVKAESKTLPFKQDGQELDKSEDVSQLPENVETIFFSGIAQSSGSFNERTHSFRPQDSLSGFEIKLQNVKEPDAREKIEAELLVINHKYDDMVKMYEASSHKPTIEHYYMKALCYVDVKKVLDILDVFDRKGFKRNLPYLQDLVNGVLLSSLPVEQVGRFIDVVSHRAHDQHLHTKALQTFFKNELDGSYTESTAQKLDILIKLLNKTPVASETKFSINFNLRKLVQQLRDSNRFSSKLAELLSAVNQRGLSASVLSLSTIIDNHLQSGKLDSLIDLLAGWHHEEEAVIELHRVLSIRRLENKLANLSAESLIKLYGKHRQAKKPIVGNLFLEIADAFHLDSVVVDLVDNWRNLSNPRLQHIYFDTLLRLPLESLDPLHQMMKKFSDVPLADVKLCIKQSDIELAYKKFEAAHLKPLVLQFQRQHLQHFLYVYYAETGVDTKSDRQRIDAFVRKVDTETLLVLYFSEQDYNQKIAIYLPKQYESLWDATVEAEERRAKELASHKAGPSAGQQQQNSVVELSEREQERAKLIKQVELYLLELEAILEECEVTPETELMPAITKLRQSATPEVIKVLQLENLHDFDFLFSDYQEVLKAVHKLRENSYQLVLEMDFENTDVVQVMQDKKSGRSASPQKFVGTGFLPFRDLTVANLPTLIMDFKSMWESSRRLVRLAPSPLVEELLVWGVDSSEPMAIYMGEKVAMLTRQQISHPVARAVSQLLSPNHSDETLDLKCKAALSIVGRIVRDDIYDFDREYEHVSEHSHYQSYLGFLEQSTFHPLQENILKEQIQSPLRWGGRFGPTPRSLMQSIRERASQQH